MLDAFGASNGTIKNHESRLADLLLFRGESSTRNVQQLKRDIFGILHTNSIFSSARSRFSFLYFSNHIRKNAEGEIGRKCGLRRESKSQRHGACQTYFDVFLSP